MRGSYSTRTHTEQLPSKEVQELQSRSTKHAIEVRFILKSALEALVHTGVLEEYYDSHAEKNIVVNEKTHITGNRARKYYRIKEVNESALLLLGMSGNLFWFLYIMWIMKQIIYNL